MICLCILQEIINWFHSFNINQELPDSNALSQHQSVMTYATLPVNNDSSVSKRLIICLLAALRANGIFIKIYNCFLIYYNNITIILL